MSRKTPFLHKLLSRLDRIDREALQKTLQGFAREHELYYDMLESLPLGVLLVDSNSTILFMNSEAANQLGWPGEKKAAGAPLADAAKDSALQKYFESFTQKPFSRETLDFQMLEPRKQILRLHVIPIEKEEVNAMAMICLSLVETHTGPSQETAAWVRRESLLKLASGVAHEIGNPLNSIRIHLELLKRDAEELSPAKQKNFLKTLSVLQSETARLDRIVRAFLKATRKPPLRFRVTSLNEIIQESVDFFQPELESREIEIRFRPDRALPDFLMDKERLREVFLNLIKNAMEAMPEGGAIRVSVTHRAKVAMVRVRDEGAGIPDEVLPHIFEAYYTTKPEGSGLGLVSVYNAVAEHGGRIEVDTRPGKGTTFTLLLPVREPRLQISGDSPALPRERKQNPGD